MPLHHQSLGGEQISCLQTGSERTWTHMLIMIYAVLLPRALSIKIIDSKSLGMIFQVCTQCRASELRQKYQIAL
jgi:hypothetical protein